MDPSVGVDKQVQPNERFCRKDGQSAPLPSGFLPSFAGHEVFGDRHLKHIELIVFKIPEKKLGWRSNNELEVDVPGLHGPIHEWLQARIRGKTRRQMQHAFTAPGTTVVT